MNSQYKTRAWRYASPRCGARDSQRRSPLRAGHNSRPRQGLEEIIVTARKVEENLQETPIAITAFSGDALRRAADLQHQRARPGRAESAVREQRAARRQQLLLAGLHSRHRPDGSDLDGRSGRRSVHRRRVHRQRGRRHDDVARHRIGAGVARPAGHAVRPQHDRRRDPADDDRSRRRVRRHGARRRRLGQPDRWLRRARRAVLRAR